VSISDEAWAWFAVHGQVGLVFEGGDTHFFSDRKPIIDLITGLRDMLRTFGQLQPRTFDVLSGFNIEDEPNTEYSRQVVLSRLAARDAARDEEVRQFRQEFLPAGPLDVSAPAGPLVESAIEKWMLDHYCDETGNDGPTWWLGDGAAPLRGEDAQRLLRLEEGELFSVLNLEPRVYIPAMYLLEVAHWKLLAYGVPSPTSGHMEEHKIPIIEGGVLHRMQQLSSRLVERYGWTEAQASTFIVTGLPPVRLPITVWTQRNERLPGLSVIHLAVDPGMSPKEVGDAYLEERKRLLGTRYRDLSEKHLALAVFVSMLPQRLSWAARMEEWNNRYGSRGWGYTQVANFSHDSLQAQRRLLRSEVSLDRASEAGATGRMQSPSHDGSTDESEEAGYVEAWAK
jgi:hypothetical protein